MVNSVSNLLSPFPGSWPEENEYSQQQVKEPESSLITHPEPEFLCDDRPLPPLSPLSSSLSPPSFAPEVKKSKRGLTNRVSTQDSPSKKKQREECNTAKERNDFLTQSLGNSPDPKTLKVAPLKEVSSRAKGEVYEDKVNELNKIYAAKITDLQAELALEKSLSHHKDEMNKTSNAKITELQTKLWEQEALSRAKDEAYKKLVSFNTELQFYIEGIDKLNSDKTDRLIVFYNTEIADLKMKLNQQGALSHASVLSQAKVSPQTEDKKKEKEINNLKNFFHRKITDLTEQLLQEKALSETQDQCIAIQGKTIEDLQNKLSNLQKATSS